MSSSLKRLVANEIVCNCFKTKQKHTKKGFTEAEMHVSDNIRISHLLSDNLGGRITFGNQGQPYPINYLGGIEGQPGGTAKPLRNKF
jgi:hypothetical protein